MRVSKLNIPQMSRYCFANVFRTNTKKPGFVHLDFGVDINSTQLRTIMVNLKKELSKLTQEQFNKPLIYKWLTRFDQQENTKYHLDNTDDQSFLMLGYEPSKIKSELYLADYVKFCEDNDGLGMFHSGQDIMFAFCGGGCPPVAFYRGGCTKTGSIDTEVD